MQFNNAKILTSAYYTFVTRLLHFCDKLLHFCDRVFDLGCKGTKCQKYVRFLRQPNLGIKLDWQARNPKLRLTYRLHGDREWQNSPANITKPGLRLGYCPYFTGRRK